MRRWCSVNANGARVAKRWGRQEGWELGIQELTMNIESLVECCESEKKKKVAG